MGKLKKSKVVFHPDNHTYTLFDKELSGVTALLHRTLFTDMYDGVPQNVLDAAAERGTFIHKLIEDYHTVDIDFEDEELKQYKLAVGKLLSLWEASEYLVSDNERYASMIDLVYRNGSDVTLSDIKTVSKMDRQYVDYCSWQLSIYAYLFERQNPKLRVKSLSVVYIPKNGGARLIEVARKSDEQIEELFKADSGKCALPEKSDELPLSAEDNVTAVNIFRQLKKAQDDYDALRAKLLSLMQENNIYEATIGGVKLTRKAAYQRESIDTAKLKAEHPSIAEQYKKVTNVAESLLIKIK